MSAVSDMLENAEADLTPQMRNLINLLWGDRRFWTKPFAGWAAGSQSVSFPAPIKYA